MSKTVIDVIKRAYRLIGVYSTGEELTSDESTDGLTALNSMLDDWATDPLMAHVKVLDSITLTPGTSVYTLGASGTVVTDRPETIDASSYIEWLGASYKLTLVTLEEYNDIYEKAATSDVPELLFYKGDYPNATLTLWPTPTVAATLKLWSVKPVTSFVELTEQINLPPGYINAIVFNLAMALAPEFGQPIPKSVAQQAAMTKKRIKRQNYQPLMLTIDRVPARFNILSGQ